MIMINKAYLEALQEYMASGRMEEDFHNSPEERRFEILEFLDLFMDVAETTDKTATKLIFKRGMPGIPPAQ